MDFIVILFPFNYPDLLYFFTFVGKSNIMIQQKESLKQEIPINNVTEKGPVHIILCNKGKIQKFINERKEYMTKNEILMCLARDYLYDYV